MRIGTEQQIRLASGGLLFFASAGGTPLQKKLNVAVAYGRGSCTEVLHEWLLKRWARWACGVRSGAAQLIEYLSKLINIKRKRLELAALAATQVDKSNRQHS